MECNDAWSFLGDIRDMTDVQLSSSELSELKSLELIVSKDERSEEPEEDTDIISVRTQLMEITSKKKALRAMIHEKEAAEQLPPRKLMKKDSDYRRLKGRLRDLEVEEKPLRTKFIDLVQTAAQHRYLCRVNGESVSMTYRGRELLRELDQRMERVRTMQLRDFTDELEEVKTHFQICSAKARAILKRISPKFPTTDEMHFRSAAVGLSGRSEDAGETAKLFCTAYEDIMMAANSYDPVYVTLAESLVLIAKDESDLEKLIERALGFHAEPWGEAYSRRDKVRAISIILSSTGDTHELLKRTKRLSEEYFPRWPSAAALLAARTMRSRDEEDDILERYADIRSHISQRQEAPLENMMAAALMAATNVSPEDVVGRFQKAMSILERLNVASMEVPSAMVAILPYSVEEAMDNLRLASAAISRNRLSLGGVENLSLGMKLLVHPAAFPRDLVADKPETVSPIFTAGRSVPSVLSIAGVSVAFALALSAGILAFHEFTLHRTAVSDFVFHPVHYHFVYG